MSNHLAIAGTTATLVQLLDESVTRDFNGAHASPGRPDIPGASEADPEVRVFLYRVETNSARSNDDLPTRSDQATLLERPQAALTLNYLLTFLGNETDYEPQRLLGIAVGTLHFHPVLTRGEIERMIVAAGSGDPLSLVDLAEQPDLIRLTPLSLSLEDLSNLWSSFFQVEYRLSVAFRAEVVMLTPPSSPSRPLPVRERRLYASTILRPFIRTVTPADGPAAPVTPGSTIVIEGRDLRGGDTTFIRFGETRVPLATVTSTKAEVVVPNDVRAGAVGIVVEHEGMMGDPAVLRPAGQSNLVPIVVHPRIKDDGNNGHLVVVRGGAAENPTGVFSGFIDVSVDPPVGKRQDVSVVLNAIDGDGEAFSFSDERRDLPGAAEATNELDIAFTGVPTGDYLVRVVVSGAESPLEIQTAVGPSQGTFSAPRMSMP
ncbi:MAG: DUF4255 domain-containing protein [Mycetocola sp.]